MTQTTMAYATESLAEPDSTLLELLDRVLNAGVVLAGEVTITVADIELIYLRLQLLVSSAETARQADWLPPRHASADWPNHEDTSESRHGSMDCVVS
ncbi:MAG: gas vesicle protein [Thermoguttaceae bacterium]|jgi:hypothetical protein